MAEVFLSHPTGTTALNPVVSPAPPWDEVRDSQAGVRSPWRGMDHKIHRWSAEQRGTISASAARMIADLGTTFNVYSDVNGAGQPYELDPIPLIVSAAEWSGISEGLCQRTRLLDLVLTDLYGPKRLLKEGLIPPDLVNASPSFLHHACGVQSERDRFLVTTGCDLVRTPAGQWSVLRDHTCAPGGLGQVLENRNVTSNLQSDLFESERVVRLGAFFDLERRTLEELLPLRGETKNVVILTPGFRHPSYFEHAYKARLLGFPLVEPADLTVRERRVYLKTLAGLRRVDVVVSRLKDIGLDPLEQWAQGGGGVPGIVEAWRSGNVAIANGPGSGFAETPALMPFLPRICKKWLNEELKLPFIETWWLGQTQVRREVLDQLHRYILMPAFRADSLLPVRCANLSPAAKKQWLTAIEQRPHDFVVQLDLPPSQIPALENRAIRRRPVIWRAFVINSAEGQVAMSGGLAKVGKASQPPQLWASHAGFTKDVWIPAPDGGAVSKVEIRIATHSRGHQPTALEVPSRIAEQLFWVGRYAERIELATRLLRVTLRNLSGEAGRHQQQQLAACLTLVRGSRLLPKEVVILPTQTLRTLSILIHDPAARGGIPALTRSLLLNAAAARDRLSDDTWRFFNRLEAIVHRPVDEPNVADLLGTLDNLVLHLAAFAGMEAENMTRGQGWRFLEAGRRLERGIGGLALLRTASAQGNGDLPILSPLLETCDSVMTYRRRHFSVPVLTGVIDLIFFDRTNPRSVAYQIEVLNREVPQFAGDQNVGFFPRIREILAQLHGRFSEPTHPSTADLVSLSKLLESFADLLTQHYFSHSVRRVY